MKKLKIKIKSYVFGWIIGVVCAIALVLSGCGQKQEAGDASGRVIENIDGSELIQNDSEEGENSSEEIAARDSEAGDDIIESASDGDITEEPETTERKIETVHEERDYLKYMTEDEIKSLAAEALSKSGYETGLPEGKIHTKGITFDLPDGFFESEDYSGMYVTKRYPIDASNILYLELDVDYTLQLIDESYFKDMVELAFTSSLEQDVEVKISEFSQISIDGVPAFRVVAEYDLEDNHFTHLMYAINGTKTYVIIYTQTHDYDRMDIFEESAATISVVK